MGIWELLFVAGVALVVLRPVWDRYRHQKRIEVLRRYADIGAKCATEAGFVMDDYSEGLWDDNPVYNFKHRLFPDLGLSIQNNRWHIREVSAAALLPLAGFKAFKEQHGEHLSVSDFRDIADEYRTVVERRRRTVGWGCDADLTPHRIAPS
jgi:hypothetical protein